MSGVITCRVLRPLMLHGERQEAGAVLRVSAADASLILESGRGELVDRADFAAIKTAVDDATTKALRRTGAGRSLGPPPDPWQPRN